MAYYVFLDTNIYEESSFSFENGKFSKLKELTKEENVILLYNEVIYREVRKHIESFVKDAVAEYNAAVKNRGFAPFRKDNEYLALLDEQSLIDKQLRAWGSYLEDCHAVKIATEKVNVDIILDKYFKGLLPFESKKPNEFKDAITIESIIEYYKDLGKKEWIENIYVVAADNGVRKSFRNDKSIVTFNSLNKFINYVILHTEYLAVAINRQIEMGIFDDYIEEKIIDDVYLANCDVDGCYDDLDITEVEYLSHKVGYIDIVDSSLAEITLEISAKISVEYTERDEDNSCYDREEGGYLWEEFIEYKETHEVSFEAMLKMNTEELDEKEVRNKVNKMNELLEELSEPILDIKIEPDTIFIPKDTIISMDEWTLVGEKEVISQTIDKWEDEEEYTGEKAYTTCPDCGKPISHQNDGGNGFCIECASEH